MGTCTPAELTDPVLEPNDLLYRLFHEEGVRVFDPHILRHQCRCSEERVTGMLKSLPREEVEALAINGIIDVTCEFCNKNYRFDEKQRATLYKD
jgi:molecular chaperone Hsp33